MEYSSHGITATPKRRATPHILDSLWGLQLRTCAAFIIFLIGILLWVITIIYGSPLTPKQYSFRHAESRVMNYHDGYEFDKLEIVMAEMGLVPVTVEIISKTPPLINLPPQIEYKTVDLGDKPNDYFTYFLDEGTKFSVYWHSNNMQLDQNTCSTRVVMVRTDAALTDLQKDHAPDESLVLFDTTSSDHQSTEFTIDNEDTYNLFFSNQDYAKRWDCSTDFVLSFRRTYYDVTQLRAADRGSIYTYPIGQKEMSKTFVDSPSYPLVMFYTPREEPPINGTVWSDMTVKFHPDRRFNVGLLITFIVLGFFFVVGGSAVMVLTIQKTMAIRKDAKNAQFYSAPYARFT